MRSIASPISWTIASKRCWITDTVMRSIMSLPFVPIERRTGYVRCWIAPRDIVPGTSYGEAIIDAIHGAKVMVLVFSSNANTSAHIPKEVERAVSGGVTILPFRIEDIAPGKSLDYFIGSVHWLDAMTPPMEKHLDDLAATVHKLIPTKGDQEAPKPQGTAIWQSSTATTASATSGQSVAGSQTTPASSSKAKIWTGVAAVVVLAALAIGVVVLHSGKPKPDGPWCWSWWKKS